jgi:large subunit ribosomal protein L23
MIIQPYEILKKPLLTEKSTQLKDGLNQVSFEVDKNANKKSIKKAVQDAFSVTVLDVRTMIVRGKTKRMGRYEGRRSNWKKAIVSLKEGEKIDLFEGV